MNKRRIYNKFETSGKIFRYVNECLAYTNQKTVTDKTVRNWLTLKNKGSKFKSSNKYIEKKRVGPYMTYNMEDVTQMLRMDQKLDIDEIFDYMSPENQIKIEEERQDGIFKYYSFLHMDDYYNDESIRRKIDSTVALIKTGVMVNLMLNTGVNKSMYELDEDKVLASAFHHVIKDDGQDHYVAISIEENDNAILTGDLNFYLKKAK